MPELMEFIQQNLTNPMLSPEMVAEKAGCSTNYARSLFKSFVGYSIPDYIRTPRIELSKTLLDTTSLSANDISDQCGFTSRSSFFTIFRKETGITPGEHRMLNGKEEAKDSGT